MAVQVVSFHCVLKNKLGKIIGRTFNHDVVVGHKENCDYLKGLVDGLKNLKKGEKRNVVLRADQAYGFYNPELVLNVRLDQLDLDKPLRVGESIFYARQGKQDFFRVIQLSEDLVRLDGNHPLAGQDLVFEIEATEAREATADDFDENPVFSRETTFH